jgi:hypothetical protein
MMMRDHENFKKLTLCNPQLRIGSRIQNSIEPGVASWQFVGDLPCGNCKNVQITETEKLYGEVAF